MTLEEMKLAVCEKLRPELLTTVGMKDGSTTYYWHDKTKDKYPHHEIHWPTEGLQVCHEAEKLLDSQQRIHYWRLLAHQCDKDGMTDMLFWPYEQRLEALCRVWFPERFAK